MPLPSQPRFRLYTRLSHYGRILLETLSGTTTRGEAVAQLTASLKERFGSRHVFFTPMARVAIYLAVKHLVPPGKKVILSPYTISDVVNMVICAGAVPVFADVERETCNIDPAEIERLLDADTGAVLITHFHGLSCDMDRVMAICQKANVPLIEDAAQAFATTWKGKPVGTFGAAGIFSFGMYKYVQSFYGGLLLLEDDTLGETVAGELADYHWQDLSFFLRKVKQGVVTDTATAPLVFQLGPFWIFRHGILNDIKKINDMAVGVDLDPQMKTQVPDHYLGRPRPLQARILLSQLPQVEENLQWRCGLARIYQEGLAGVSPDMLLPPWREDGSHTYSTYPVLVKNRTQVLKYLMANGCDLAAQHTKNCADMTCFASFYRDCPHAREVADSILLLPTYPGYSQKSARRNVRMLRRYFGLAD